MTTASITAKERKKLITDLRIIGIVSFLALGIVVFVMQNGMNNFAGDRSIPVVLRVLVIGLCGQFGISGLGISIVCLIRKQRFREFGLNTRNRFCLRGNVHPCTRSCRRNTGGCIRNGGNLYSDLRNADCSERNGERLGMHSDFLRLLECNLIIRCFPL